MTYKDEISGTTISNELKLKLKEESSLFEFENTLILKDHPFSKSVSFKNCRFSTEVDFSYCVFEKNLKFVGCVFEKSFRLVGATVKGTVNSELAYSKIMLSLIG
jgi:hypothetical protein